LTPTITLNMLRPLAGASTGATSTPSVALLLLKALAGTISLDTTTPAPVLNVLRRLTGIRALITITSQIEVEVFVPTPLIAGELSALVQARLLAVEPRCPQLTAMPGCRQISALLEK
jgi:hypothetical protein